MALDHEITDLEGEQLIAEIFTLLRDRTCCLHHALETVVMVSIACSRDLHNNNTGAARAALEYCIDHYAARFAAGDLSVSRATPGKPN